MQTTEQINDQVAADALSAGSKSSPIPTHPAMQPPEENPEANETDASQDDYFDNEEGQ